MQRSLSFARRPGQAVPCCWPRPGRPLGAWVLLLRVLRAGAPGLLPLGGRAGSERTCLPLSAKLSLPCARKRGDLPRRWGGGRTARFPAERRWEAREGPTGFRVTAHEPRTTLPARSVSGRARKGLGRGGPGAARSGSVCILRVTDLTLDDILLFCFSFVIPYF